LAHNLKDDCEIDAEIKSAEGSFQAIWNQFFSAKGTNNVHKTIANEGVVLSILLYSCETLSLSKQKLNRLAEIADFSQQLRENYVQRYHVACQRTQNHSGEPGASDAVGNLSVLSC
jgi:LPS sulfotransferase NodH